RKDVFRIRSSIQKRERCAIDIIIQEHPVFLPMFFSTDTIHILQNLFFVSSSHFTFHETEDDKSSSFCVSTDLMKEEKMSKASVLCFGSPVSCHPGNFPVRKI